jgi:stage II sporulation protein R
MASVFVLGLSPGENGNNRNVKSIFAFLGIGATVLAAICCMAFTNGEPAKSDLDFLRLHVSANSNSARDQEVKFLVKQRIVDSISPVLAGVKSKGEAMERIAENINQIESVANECLSSNGFSYGARVAVRSEYFPTRVYKTTDEELNLPNGIYDALVLELGEGRGDNWWCVVYPPLCVSDEVSAEKVVYKSKILEWFKR